MKKLFLVLFTNILLHPIYSQPYWQQYVDYNIDVSLNDKEKTLDGFEKLTYYNNSPDTLKFIWFHLWPNAYKNDHTAFSDQLLENGNTKFYFSTKEEKGYVNRLDFKVDGTIAKTEDHPQHIDIVKLLLPKPLPPKEHITITTPFHVKLPFNFSRGGFDGQTFQVTQWYPKPAVYDRKGWHEMPYLDQGEFYSEFGSFDVSITLPKDYVVAATGELQNAEEKEWLKSRTDFSLPSKQKMAKQPTGRRTTRISSNARPPKPAFKTNVQETKTLQYKQADVHDFAWFADKTFIVNSDTLQLPSLTVNVSTFYTPGEKKLWQKSLQYAKDALRFYNYEVGNYPYTTATVVQGPESFGGGMEYPTITIIAPASSAEELDATIAHELGHNWFYGMLASNERKYPWMDEGMNTFYENKYTESKYGKQEQYEEWLFQHKARNKTDQPIATSSEDFSSLNYGLVAYHKTGRWMKELEQKMGKDGFRKMMHRYFDQWKLKHPQPDDFKQIVSESISNDAEPLIAQLDQKGILPGNELKGLSVVSPLKKGSFKNYLISPTRDFLLLSPALGFNSYDKLMIGGLLTNYGSPTTKFNFLAIPLYATGSKSFTGSGKLNYAITSNGVLRKTDIFLNASSFHMDRFKDSANDLQMRFVKLVPGIRFTFRENNPRSTVSKYIQWKTYLFNEQKDYSLNVVSVDSIFRQTDTGVVFHYSAPWKKRYLNQLQFVYQNSRALYPFDATLQMEQGQDFIRTTLTGNYFFNYSKGGGLGVRFFAGKFNYLNGKTDQKELATDPYQLNLTGPDGYEDYTYSNYFVGRNKFGGLASQQIMIRDGTFKVRTDLLANKEGKTDNWLSAVNLVTTIPENINPFAVLPIKLPVRAFADIGTYADAWNRNNDADRFLFDAGLQFALFREVLNIYVPLLYSSVYKNYFKSYISDNRFWKKISFSINFYNKDIKKLNREAEF